MNGAKVIYSKEDILQFQSKIFEKSYKKYKNCF